MRQKKSHVCTCTEECKIMGKELRDSRLLSKKFLSCTVKSFFASRLCCLLHFRRTISGEQRRGGILFLPWNANHFVSPNRGRLPPPVCHALKVVGWFFARTQSLSQWYSELLILIEGSKFPFKSYTYLHCIQCLVLLQRLAKVFVCGCKKFVPALAYLFCLALPGSCLAKSAYFLAELCRCHWIH